MIPPFDYLEHRSTCQKKQAERSSRIANLPVFYTGPYTTTNRSILATNVEDLVNGVHSGTIKPIEILRAYGKAAIKAHARTNCLTEVMLPEAEHWLAEESNLQGPLSGIPVSLKDTIVARNYDASVGYSKLCGKPLSEDGAIVRLLKDAGAVPYVKTANPISLLSFESTNDVWGRCTNPYNSKYSPGGSTGGEGALLALGGSRIGIGSDVAGSVRAPAHFSGIYSLRCSTGRWPKMGVQTSMPGQEGIPSVYSPMARTLADLTYFSKSILSMSPEKYDHSVHGIPWRQATYESTKKQKTFKIGVLRTDGVVDPSPACARALEETVEALKADGHELFDVEPPSPYDALVIASQLLLADGCKTYMSNYRTWEWNDAGAAQFLFLMKVPRPIKYLWYLWTKYVKRDPIWAGLIRHWHPQTAYQQWQWVAKREAYKAKFHQWWEKEAQMDFMITPPNALPATPHDAMKNAAPGCGYTFLFNLLDYACGIIPVTHVDKSLDQLPSGFNLSKLNGVARGMYMYYNATDMHGLPVAVQIVSKRLEEEKTLAIMERVQESLEKHGSKYELLDIVG